mgnify:CR=1 FL=1
MSGQGSLRVPVFVTHRKEAGFRLRCLFLPEIEATAVRYELALNKLRQAVVDTTWPQEAAWSIERVTPSKVRDSSLPMTSFRTATSRGSWTWMSEFSSSTTCS